MRRWLRDHSLTLTMLGLFVVCLIGQSLTGHREYNQDQTEHGEETVGYAAYLRTGHFVEATFENWESEYLQMALYVLLTTFLFQRGSSESKNPDGDEPVDEDPRGAGANPDAPWAVRRGGAALAIYQHSLTLVLLLLFLLSFILHAAGGPGSTARSKWHTGSRRSRSLPTCGRRASGSSRSRTGRASSWRWRHWRGSRSIYGTADHPSPSRLLLRTGRQARGSRRRRCGRRGSTAGPLDRAACWWARL